MTRLFLFLISYGLVVISTTQIIFYLNYRSLGYEWRQVFFFIVRTGDFALLVVSVIILTFTVAYRAPSRSPFFGE